MNEMISCVGGHYEPTPEACQNPAVWITAYEEPQHENGEHVVFLCGDCHPVILQMLRRNDRAVRIDHYFGEDQ